MMNGSPDAIAAEAANATAPSAGPASRDGVGLALLDGLGERLAERTQDLGLGLEAVLVEVPRRATTRAEDEVALE